jgi:hypothetical protein
MDKHQFAEFASRVIANLPRDIPSGYASHLIGNPEILRGILEKELLVPKQRVKIPALLRGGEMPARKEGFDWPWPLRIQDRSPEEEVVMKLEFVRRGEINHTFLGLQHALWLVQHQHEIPLLWPSGIKIHFPGMTVGDTNGTDYMSALVSEPPSPRSYEGNHSWKIEWVPAEEFGRGEAYVAIAE